MVVHLYKLQPKKTLQKDKKNQLEPELIGRSTIDCFISFEPSPYNLIEVDGTLYSIAGAISKTKTTKATFTNEEKIGMQVYLVKPGQINGAIQLGITGGKVTWKVTKVRQSSGLIKGIPPLFGG